MNDVYFLNFHSPYSQLSLFRINSQFNMMLICGW